TRIFYPLHQLGDAAIERPIGQARGKSGGTGNVRVLISGNLHSAIARGLDMLDQLLHVSPVVLPGNLDVQDVHRQAPLFADFDGLIDRANYAATFVTDVRSVDAAILTCNFAQLDEFIGLGKAVRRIDQSAGEPDGALAHRVIDQLAHAIKLFG